jgi:hypothetical protein
MGNATTAFVGIVIVAALVLVISITLSALVSAKVKPPDSVSVATSLFAFVSNSATILSASAYPATALKTVLSTLNSLPTKSKPSPATKTPAPEN